MQASVYLIILRQLKEPKLKPLFQLSPNNPN
jgi:hypothetical protein